MQLKNKDTGYFVSLKRGCGFNNKEAKLFDICMCVIPTWHLESQIPFPPEGATLTGRCNVGTQIPKSSPPLV